MNRSILVLLTLIIILTTTACLKSNSSLRVESDNEITIIYTMYNTFTNDPFAREANQYLKHLDLFIEEFTRETGIKVNLISTAANTYDDYLLVRNTQLYLPDGPTLILISGGEGYKELVEEGVALRVEGKIPNYANIYDSLKDGYFVPMAMAVRTFVLNKNILKNLDIKEPNIDWNVEDINDIRRRFYTASGIFLTRNTINFVIEDGLSKYQPFLLNGRSEMATNEIVREIENIRYLLVESDTFKKIEGYTNDKYHRLVNEFSGFTIEERRKYFSIVDSEIKINPILPLYGSVNLLNSLETFNNKSRYIDRIHDVSIDDVLILPDPFLNYHSWGFIVNRNGKNTEKGLQFLDFVLSNKAQLKIFLEMDDRHDPYRVLSFSYPVLKTIEEGISKIEKREEVDEHLIQARKKVINQIKEGERSRRTGRMHRDKESIFYRELYNLIVKVIFSNQRYTSDEIMRELRQFDNMMNIRFSE